MRVRSRVGLYRVGVIAVDNGNGRHRRLGGINVVVLAPERKRRTLDLARRADRTTWFGSGLISCSSSPLSSIVSLIFYLFFFFLLVLFVGRRHALRRQSIPKHYLSVMRASNHCPPSRRHHGTNPTPEMFCVSRFPLWIGAPMASRLVSCTPEGGSLGMMVMVVLR